jgi:hypothetical protein
VASYDDLETIDIMTDARHGWHNKAKDTSVVAIRENTHKVLKCEHVTKTDDLVTQRHEKIGTERIYVFVGFVLLILLAIRVVCLFLFVPPI